MNARWIGAALLIGFAAATIGPLSAQQSAPARSAIMSGGEDEVTAPPSAAIPVPPRGQSGASAFGHDPDLDTEDQLAPSQIKQPMPAAVAEPSAAESLPHDSGRDHAGSQARPTGIAAQRGAKSRHAQTKPLVVACSGIFARDSNHRKLAMTFASRNVAYTQVDASHGMHMASVLFEKDPKRRLEVWWSDPTGRSDTHLIVINGESTWMAPGGLTLGMTLAQLEKLNGKPFKLLGFDRDGVAVLSDWNGGELAKPPGGCRLGISLRADANFPAAALAALSAERQYGSDSEAFRRVNPTISEILVGY